MIRKHYKIVSIVLLSILLTGCWDYTDINERAIGITAGLDIVDDKLEISGEKVKPASSPSGEGGGDNKITETYKFKATGINFEDMRKSNEAQLPAAGFEQSTIAFVISKRYAELRGLESYMNRVYFAPGLRSSIHACVVKETMDELFKKKVENAISIGYGIETTLRYLEKERKTVLKSVQEIQSDMNFGSIGYLIPYITVENNTVRYLGFAAMVDSKLVDIINEKEIGGFLLLLAKKTGDTRAFASPRNDKNLLSIKSELKKRKIKTSYEDNRINIYIDLKLESSLQYQYYIEPFTDEDKKKIEEIIENEIKKSVMSAIDRSKNQFKSDVFGFARFFKAQNFRVYKNINWKEEYPRAVFHVNVSTAIGSLEALDPNAKKPK